MKQFSIGLALALLATGQATTAQTLLQHHGSYQAKATSSIVLTPDSNNLKIHLQCDNPTGERILISIRSGNMDLYNQSTTARNVSKTFDLSQLEDGEYYITVSKGRERTEKRIQLQTATVIQRLQVVE